MAISNFYWSLVYYQLIYLSEQFTIHLYMSYQIFKAVFQHLDKSGWNSNRILFLYHTPERIGLKYSLKYLSTILSSYSTNRCWLQCCNRLFLDNCHSSCYFKDHKAILCRFITKARVLLYHHQYRNTSCNSYFLHLSCSNATNLLSSEGKTHNSV